MRSLIAEGNLVRLGWDLDQIRTNLMVAKPTRVVERAKTHLARRVPDTADALRLLDRAWLQINGESNRGGK